MKKRIAGFLFLLMVTASGVSFAGQATSADPVNLKELVAKAKASSHVVTLPLEATDSETIKSKEKGFESKYGFPLTMESQPGHHRDMPMKVVESAKSDRAI